MVVVHIGTSMNLWIGVSRARVGHDLMLMDYPDGNSLPFGTRDSHEFLEDVK